ncbi:phage tail assembly protein T [Campylobacter insulaenigrae]
MTQAEFNEWMEFLSNEPLACDRNEIQISILLSMIASFMGVKNKCEDFLLSEHLKPISIKQSAKKNQNIDLEKLSLDFLELLG